MLLAALAAAASAASALPAAAKAFTTSTTSPPPPAPSAALTVPQAIDSLQRDLALLDTVHTDLIELSSCLSVETPPDCIPDWRRLQGRLAAAADACDRARGTSPIVGAAIAERRPVGGGRGRGGGQPGGLSAALEGALGRQVGVADLEFFEEVEAKAERLDDRLVEAAAVMREGAGSFSAFEGRVGEVLAVLGAVLAAARVMLAAGGL